MPRRKVENSSPSSPPPLRTITKTNGVVNDIAGDSMSKPENDEAPTPENPTASLSWLSKLAYAFLGLPYSMQLSIIAFYINEFLLDVARVSPVYNAAILFTSRAIDGLTDPIGGYLFSRCSFRWGKMRPWILFSSVFVALAYFGVWFLIDVSDGGKLAYYLIAHSMLWTVMTASRIPHTALTVYLTVNQREREQLTYLRTFLEAAGLLLSIVFHSGITTLFGATKDKNCTDPIKLNDSIEENAALETTEIGANVVNAYMTSAGIVSFVFLLASVLLFFGVQEVVDVIPTNKMSFAKGFKKIVRYRAYVTLTIASVAALLATQSIQSVLELYLTHVKKRSDLFPFLAGTLIISTMLLIFVWTLVMRRIGKKRSFIIGNLFILPAVIILSIAQAPIPLLFVAAVLGANTVACGFVLPWAMLPECIDLFFLQTGTRPVEIFYTFFFLGSKLVQALYSGVVQLALSASGYDVKKCEQDESVSLTITIMIGAVPGVVALLATICLFFYPIDDKKSKEIHEKLEAMRKQSSQKPSRRSAPVTDHFNEDTYF